MVKKAAKKDVKKDVNMGGDDAPWVRISKGGLYTKADKREVDEAGIGALLQQRMVAKAAKNFAVADQIAAQLQAMGICYLDGSREWYTKVVVEKKLAVVPKEKINVVQGVMPKATGGGAIQGIKKTIKKKEITPRKGKIQGRRG